MELREIHSGVLKELFDVIIPHISILRKDQNFLIRLNEPLLGDPSSETLFTIFFTLLRRGWAVCVFALENIGENDMKKKTD